MKLHRIVVASLLLSVPLEAKRFSEVKRQAPVGFDFEVSQQWENGTVKDKYGGVNGIEDSFLPSSLLNFSQQYVGADKPLDGQVTHRSVASLMARSPGGTMGSSIKRQVRRPRDRGHVSETLSKFARGWRNIPFFKFSAQCSHNTYLWGKQSNLPLLSKARTVHEDTMTMALSLGYRCIEVDVWPRKAPAKSVDKKRWFGPGSQKFSKAQRKTISQQPSLVKVTHAMNTAGDGVFLMTNSVDLSLFIQKILEWCEADEKRKPATDNSPKLPIVISIENNVKTKEQENYIFQLVSWLNNNSKTGAYAERIVLPEKFKSKTTMGDVMATKGQRKIILKSKLRIKSEGADEMYKAGLGSNLHKVIAMNSPKTSHRKQSSNLWFQTHVSKSIEMGLQGVTKSQRREIAKRLRTGHFVRTYPHMLAVDSVNYAPGPAFKEGAQMVCINMQGKCENTKICKLLPDKRSGAIVDQCRCQRDVAGQLEKAFSTYGYDGYIDLRKIQSDMRKDSQMQRAFESLRATTRETSQNPNLDENVRQTVRRSSSGETEIAWVIDMSKLKKRSAFIEQEEVSVSNSTA